MNSSLSLFLFLFVASCLVVGTLQSCSAGFNSGFLRGINEGRSYRGAKPLMFGLGLNSYAQTKAEQIAAIGSYDYRYEDPMYGQNYFYKNPGSSVDGYEVPVYWALQSSWYTFQGREPDMTHYTWWRHYTQMMWKGSRLVGVGCARTTNGTNIVVANFYPKGNIPGLYAINV